jgi:hypothetical protein
MGQRSEMDEDTPFAVSLKGKDTKGFENTIVTVRGRFPQEELQNVALAASAVNSGLVSSRDAASKYMYTQDPERMWRRWLEEKAASDPTWRQFFQSMYLQMMPTSPVSQALQEAQGGQGQPDMPMDAGGAEPTLPGGDQGLAANGPGVADMGGGAIAAALAQNGGDVQQGVQRTPVTSNLMSAFLGNAGGPGRPSGG